MKLILIEYFFFLLKPLRYARLEKADILEMVVKHLKEIKKRRQAMVEAMEPILFRSFKLGFLDCAKISIEFIDGVQSAEDKKQQIIDHISKECMKTIQSSCPPPIFKQHHEIAFAYSGLSDNFAPFPMLSSEWPSLEEKLGFFPLGKFESLSPKNISFPELMSSSLMKIGEPRASAFNVRLPNSSFETPSTSASVTIDEIQHRSDSLLNETSDEDDDDVKLIIDDPNNNQMTWRPWL